MFDIFPVGDLDHLSGKARNLVDIDSKGFTSNFLIVTDSLFQEYMKTCDIDPLKYILNTQIDENIVLSIISKLNTLKITDPIFRSAYLSEDTDDKSFAGILESYKGTLENVDLSIRKVWASQYTEKFNAYMKNMELEPKYGMDVIIQQYIEPKLGGVIFYENKSKSVYIEFTMNSSDVQMGSCDPHYVLVDGEDIYFSSRECEYLFDHVFLNIILSSVQKFNDGNYDLEFISDGSRVYIIQKRIISREVKYDLPFLLFGTSLNDLSLSDVSLDLINSFFQKINLDFEAISISVNRSEILTDLQSLKLFNNQLNLCIKDEKYISYLRKKIIELERNYLEEIRNISISSISKKNIEFKTEQYLIDTNIYLMIEKIKNLLKKKGIDESNSSHLFRPDRPTLSSINLARKLKGEPELINNPLVDYDLLTSIPKQRKRKILDHTNNNWKNNHGLIKNLQVLIWLHDACNYFVDVISYKYDILFKKMGLSKKYCNNDKFRKNIDTISERYPGNEPNYGLRGIVASKGDFQGYVRICKIGENLSDVKSDEVIVTRDTTPQLVCAMAVCSGIITEKGGLISHAAIVSRELGTPCVIGVKGCLSNLNDGDFICVSGGKITLKEMEIV